MTQEFNLSVTPVGNSQYLIRTEQVPYGAPLAEEQVTWPVDQWLEDAQQLMGDPLKALLQGAALDAAGRSALSLVELGQKLYAGLFRDTVRESWVISQGVAQSRREGLRLRLGLKNTELMRLPWEVMYGTDVPVEQLRQGSITSAPRPMVAGTRIIFSRYQFNSLNSRLNEDSFPELAPHQPIRILMVVSAPTDQEQLKLYREVKHMQQELQTPAASPSATPAEIQLTILNQPGREELAHALEQGRFQVLHYAGHSDLSAAGGSLYLVNSHTGLSEILSGDDLAGLLVNTGIRLAVFNSCRGTYTAAAHLNGSGNRNLAEALVSRGIPAVLAMAEQIPDNVALNLTRWFYHNLKQGSPIDLSLDRARQGLVATYGSQQFYWALPVLYLHPKFSGHLLARDPMQTPLSDRYGLLPPSYATSRPLPAPLPALPESAELPRPTALHRGLEDASPASLQPEPDGLKALEPAARPAIAKMLEQLSPPVESPVEPPVESPVESNCPEPDLAEPQPVDQTVLLNGFGRDLTDSTANRPPASSPPSQTGSRKPASAAAKGSRQSASVSRFWLLPVLGALLGGAAYAGLYAGLYSLPVNLPNWELPSWLGQKPASEPSSPTPLVDPTVSTEELRAIAEDSFRQGQSKLSGGQGEIEPGIEATKLLLDRNALEEAAVAISAAPADLKDDDRINFLRGRLAWQGMKAADGEHILDQARDFWELSAAANPTSLDYQQALMFAYYEAGDARNLEKAIQTWSTANANPELSDAKALDFTALAALVLQKRADDRPAPERDDHLQNAVLLYQKVMNRDPQRFAPEALRQNWLWTEAAIKNWQALSQVKPDSDQPSPAVQSPAASPSVSPSASPSSFS